MSDWKFAQKEVSEELALLHHFSIKKNQKDGDIEFLVTVREFAAPPKGQYARFFAQADKFVNQRTAPHVRLWMGRSLLEARCPCVRMIRQFPYEGETAPAAKGAPGA